MRGTRMRSRTEDARRCCGSFGRSKTNDESAKLGVVFGRRRRFFSENFRSCEKIFSLIFLSFLSLAFHLPQPARLVLLFLGVHGNAETTSSAERHHLFPCVALPSLDVFVLPLGSSGATLSSLLGKGHSLFRSLDSPSLFVCSQSGHGPFSSVSRRSQEQFKNFCRPFLALLFLFSSPSSSSSLPPSPR